MTAQKCAAVVVGAGPAGLAVIGNLLERQLAGKIAWIDPSFQGGRVNRQYREVPSNTKVSLFQAYSTAVQPFRSVISTTPTPNPFATLAKLDQDKTCHLHHAADMMRALTEGIVKMDQVYACRGSVVAANQTRNTSNWTVYVQRPGSPDEIQLITPRLILCTGSHPTSVPVPVAGLDNLQRLDLDVVLKPSDLVSIIPRSHSQTIAIVGASHSAILALFNLFDLARTTHPHLRVKWFTRHPLRYAEFMDGWILRDNTGLKGMAADFARQQLEDAALAKSEAGRFISKVDCSGGPKREKEQMAAHLPLCSHLVQAVGFTRDPLPELSIDGYALDKPQFDHDSGGFMTESGRAVRGLFGAGIAFPERVVDPHGNVEYAVGLWKFMRFLKKVTPQWVVASS